MDSPMKLVQHTPPSASTSAAQSRLTIPEAMRERTPRTTGQPAPCRAARRGGLDLLLIDKNRYNKFLSMPTNQHYHLRNQKRAKEAPRMMDRHPPLSGLPAVACFSWKRVNNEWTGDTLLQAASWALSAQCCGKEWKLLFTRNAANGLMRLFHDSWMFAELKAFETRF